MSATNLRCAVIGSGFGGLAAAIRLQAQGFHTVLFEARDKPGGRAYVYQQDGYTFDAGPTVITAPQCLEELFACAGKKLSDYVELLPVEPFYRLIWSDGATFDYTGDEARLIEQIHQRNPKDVEGYRRFVAFSKRAFQAGYTDRVAEPFLRFRDMLAAVPSMAQLRADRSVYATVAAHVQDEHLREALSFHALLIGGNPMDVSAIYTLIHYLERQFGVFFPRGGTGALVQAMCKVFTELGGDLRLATSVQGVRLQQRLGKTQHLVATGDQPAEAFDLVVSNADLHHTYSTLYDSQPSARKMSRRLAKMDWSMSLFVLYFGTDVQYADIAHHTVIFGPRYHGLLQDIFNGPRLPEDFSLYLHRPTASDPTLAPPGCDAFYVLSPVPHLGHAAIDWLHEGPIYAEKILTALEKQLPNVRQHIVTKRHFTPTDFESELRAYHGSAFSVAPTLGQSAWFRPHNRDPDIAGLYIVGAGTHPGAGLPGVINSAKATANVIARDFGL